MTGPTYTADDFAPLNHGGLLMERQFFAASVGYHTQELASARLGLDLVEAELDRRQTAVGAA